MLVLAVAAAAVAVAQGCSGDSGPTKIALLVAGNDSLPNEATIRPNFEAKVEEYCDDCETIYRDAGGELASQRQQGESALEHGADVLVIDPVLSEYGSKLVEAARAKDVPVVNYGHLLDYAKSNVFISFDDVKNGELQAEGLAGKLARMGAPKGPVVMMNGEPGNPDEHLFQEGARHGLQEAGVQITPRRYYIPFWQASQSEREMRRAIAEFGKDGFAGVYTETDGIAEGAIAAMKSAGIDPAERPTTGRGATLPALRRILLGEQYLTMYEPPEPEAWRSARIAVALAEDGEIPPGEVTTEVKSGKVKVPAILLEPLVVTKSNIDDTVIPDGLFSPEEICAGATKSACKAEGISG